jgi:hypothetical protein
MGPRAKKSIFVREVTCFGESMPLENDLKSNIQVSVVERQSALRMNPIRYGGGGKSKVLLRDIRE